MTALRRTAPAVLALGLLVFAAIPEPLLAVVCSGPSSRPTVAAALADVTCTEIVLGAQSYPESVVISRSVLLRGAGAAATTLAGTVRVTGAGTSAELRDLLVDGTGHGGNADASEAEAVLSCRNVAAVHDGAVSAEIFADGFESGDLSAWDLTVP